MTDLAKVEALLFVVGEEGIELEELSYVLGISTADTYTLIRQLQDKYQNNPDTALHLLEAGNHFILSTKKECASLLKKYSQSPLANRLSQAALETLAIIAYKQPISRVEVDNIRGVHSSGSIQKLVSRRLIEEKGRVEGPGRAILYGTTAYFMDYFGLRTLEELPDITEMETEMTEDLPLDLFYDRFKDETDLDEAELFDRSRE